MVDTRQVDFNLACAVHAYDCMTSAEVTAAFIATGIYPFQKYFAKCFRITEDEQRLLAENQNAMLARAGPTSSVRSLKKQRTDMETLHEVKNIASRGLGPSKTVQQLLIVLRNAESVINILLSSDHSSSASTAHSSKTNRVKTIDPGAPAECLTLLEVLERRRQQEA